MRTVTIAAAVATLVSGIVGAGSGTAVAETGASAPGPIYVFNLYGAEEGRADRRPANLVASEFSSLSELTWKKWGPYAAVGTGKLSGTWCMPGCQEEPYTATILLGGTRTVNGKRYFTRFGITGDFPKPEEHVDTLIGNLPKPKQADRAEQNDRAEQGSRAEQDGRTDQADRTDRAEQGGRAEHDSRGDRTEGADQGGRTDRTDRPDRADRAEQGGRAEHAGRAEQGGRGDRADRVEQGGRGERADRVERGHRWR
ncbi:hypothetical protein AB0J63_26895 [Streptosporangium canum]|uniref:hypothetical protein n=1 Tax=Streptosporangium canum TaxID=324952 RepID=UPI0034496463